MGEFKYTITYYLNRLVKFCVCLFHRLPHPLPPTPLQEASSSGKVTGYLFTVSCPYSCSETQLRCNSLKYHLRRKLSSVDCGVLMVDGTLKRGETEGSNYIWDDLKIVLVLVHFDKKL